MPPRAEAVPRVQPWAFATGRVSRVPGNKIEVRVSQAMSQGDSGISEGGWHPAYFWLDFFFPWEFAWCSHVYVIFISTVQ